MGDHRGLMGSMWSSPLAIYIVTQYTHISPCGINTYKCHSLSNGLEDALSGLADGRSRVRLVWMQDQSTFCDVNDM